tara:strand:- start:1754 stop:1942 length:189 start_codon:yes stop_codon:yes gene_type:complete
MKIGDLVMYFSRPALLVEMVVTLPHGRPDRRPFPEIAWVQYLDTGETAWAYEEELTLVTEGN